MSELVKVQALSLEPSSPAPLRRFSSVVRAPTGPFPPARGRTKAQRSGLQFQRRVEKALQEEFFIETESSPWFRYRNSVGDQHWAQPDILVLLPEAIVVVEVKLTHTMAAWTQLRTLYMPLIEEWDGGRRRVLGVEVCRHYDRSVEFPELTSFLLAHPGAAIRAHVEAALRPSPSGPPLSVVVWSR